MAWLLCHFRIGSVERREETRRNHPRERIDPRPQVLPKMRVDVRRPCQDWSGLLTLRLALSFREETAAVTPDVLIRDRKAAEKHADAAAPTKPARPREVSLDDKYELDEGLRLPERDPRAGARRRSTQMRADRRARARHGDDDLGLPGVAARRVRQGARPRRASRARSCGSSTGRRSTRSSAPPASGAASSRRPSPARPPRASSASGTARRPASTAPPTRCATATSSAPTRRAAWSPCAATTPPASPPRCPARRSPRSRRSGCR